MKIREYAFGDKYKSYPVTHKISGIVYTPVLFKDGRFKWLKTVE